MNKCDYVSVISALIALIAMFVTLWQAVIARKAYKLEKKREKENIPDFKVDCPMESRAIIGSDEKVQLLYYVIISNLSNRDMTISEIRLRVIGEERYLVLTPVHKGDKLYIGDNIDGNKSIHKWIEFEIDKSEYNDLKIIKYIIEIEDARNNKRNVSIIYMKEEVKQND